MELLSVASLMLASAMAGVYFTREHALNQLYKNQEMLDDCVASLTRAIKLNDQMFHMIDGKTFEQAALLADLDEIWRTK